MVKENVHRSVFAEVFLESMVVVVVLPGVRLPTPVVE